MKIEEFWVICPCGRRIEFTKKSIKHTKKFMEKFVVVSVSDNKKYIKELEVEEPYHVMLKISKYMKYMSDAKKAKETIKQIGSLATYSSDKSDKTRKFICKWIRDLSFEDVMNVNKFSTTYSCTMLNTPLAMRMDELMRRHNPDDLADMLPQIQNTEMDESVDWSSLI
jgi:ribosomal protein S8